MVCQPLFYFRLDKDKRAFRNRLKEVMASRILPPLQMPPLNSGSDLL
jgi:hypothetical protein